MEAWKMTLVSQDKPFSIEPMDYGRKGIDLRNVESS